MLNGTMDEVRVNGDGEYVYSVDGQVVKISSVKYFYARVTGTPGNREVSFSKVAKRGYRLFNN